MAKLDINIPRFKVSTLYIRGLSEEHLNQLQEQVYLIRIGQSEWFPRKKISLK